MQIALFGVLFIFSIKGEMMMQLTFKLPEINRKETRDKVEAALEKYQILLLMDPEEFEPKITSSFTLTPPSKTNEFYSTTEDIAIKKVDMTEKRRKYINRIRRAVNRLSYEERLIIINRYLKNDDVFDYQVYNKLGFSESKYYRVRADAFYKLAFMLRIVVYKEVEDI